MSRILSRTGLRFGLAFLVLLVPLEVHAAESASFRLQAINGSYNVSTSQNFILMGGTSWMPDAAIASEHFVLVTEPSFGLAAKPEVMFQGFANGRLQQQKRQEIRLALQHAGYQQAGPAPALQFKPAPANTLAPALPAPTFKPAGPVLPQQIKSPLAPANYKFTPVPPKDAQTRVPLKAQTGPTPGAERVNSKPTTAAPRITPDARSPGSKQKERVSARFSYRNFIELPGRLPSRTLRVSRLGGSLLGDDQRLSFFAALSGNEGFGTWMFVLLSSLAIAWVWCPMKRKKKLKKVFAKRWRALFTASLLLLFCTREMSVVMTEGFVPHALAIQTTPEKRVFNGHLIGPNNQPVSGPHNIRFSYWKSGDFVSSDRTASGSINTSATNYIGWQEVQNVTPNFVGYFTVNLGSVTPLPDLSQLPPSTLLNLHLQIEVKPASASGSAYELLDWDSSETLDRSPMLTVPFARNADWLDQRDVGTGSGSIPVLGPGGIFGAFQIPGGTNSGTFIIDRDGSETSKTQLQFGSGIKTLTYDKIADRFDFNDDLRVQGNLTVTGLVNGIDIATLSSPTDAHLRVSSGAGLTINVATGGYRLNGITTNYAGASAVSVSNNATNYVFIGSGGLIVRTATFPTDESFIPLAEVVTSGGAITSVTDRRVLSSDDRERTVEQYFHPEYPNVSFKADGSNNVGQLWITNNSGTLMNHFVWSSTKSTLQDFDVYLPITLPSDFIHWKDHPLEVTYRSSNSGSTKNKLDITVFDTSDAQVTLSGSVANLANTSWTTTSFEFTGSPTWTPGSAVTLRLRLSSKDNEQMQLGSVKAQWVELLSE